MRIQWVEKNVDLDLLGKRVTDFFEGKGFKTRMARSDAKYIVLAQWSSSSREHRDVEAKIYGVPNDFTIELSTIERARFSEKLGLLTSLFGGGGLVLHGARLKESLEKLEEEFCTYIVEAVSQLTGSAT